MRQVVRPTSHSKPSLSGRRVRPKHNNQTGRASFVCARWFGRFQAPATALGVSPGEQAWEKWQADKGNPNIHHEMDDGWFCIAVKVPTQLLGDESVSKRRIMSATEDLGAKAQCRQANSRLAQTAPLTDSLFQRSGGRAFHLGGASSDTGARTSSEQWGDIFAQEDMFDCEHASTISVEPAMPNPSMPNPTEPKGNERAVGAWVRAKGDLLKQVSGFVEKANGKKNNPVAALRTLSADMKTRGRSEEVEFVSADQLLTDFVAKMDSLHKRKQDLRTCTAADIGSHTEKVLSDIAAAETCWEEVKSALEVLKDQHKANGMQVRKDTVRSRSHIDKWTKSFKAGGFGESASKEMGIEISAIVADGTPFSRHAGKDPEVKDMAWWNLNTFGSTSASALGKSLQALFDGIQAAVDSRVEKLKASFRGKNILGNLLPVRLPDEDPLQWGLCDPPHVAALTQPWAIGISKGAFRAGFKAVPLPGTAAFARCLEGQIHISVSSPTDLIDVEAATDLIARLKSTWEKKENFLKDLTKAAVLLPGDIAYVPLGAVVVMTSLSNTSFLAYVPYTGLCTIDSGSRRRTCSWHWSIRKSRRRPTQ